MSYWGVESQLIILTDEGHGESLISLTRIEL